MAQIPLKDILINARQESYRMRHYYLGVEHLFIALLEIKGGLAGTIFAENGFSPEYVIDAVRRKLGKGSKQMVSAGMPSTPRTEVVMALAQEIALEDNRQTIQERDLLVAILDESENIPVRVLKAFGLDMKTLRREARTRETTRAVNQTYVMRLVFAAGVNIELSQDQLFVMRRMFYGYKEVRIDNLLTGGYTSSQLLVVTPIKQDGRAEAPVVVKLGPTDTILDEAQRYERFVKGTLPPLTARLEDRPVAPDTCDLAALKYTFLADEEGNPRDMRGAIQQWQGEKLGKWLKSHLYREFGENWWKQNKPYRFEAWQEYDWVLPPMLTLQLKRDEEPDDNGPVLHSRQRRNRIGQYSYGEVIAVKNFKVQSVDRENNRIKLGLGQGMNTTFAYQIEVNGVDLEKDTYYRGEVVDMLVGQVWETRDDKLFNALRELEPDFNIKGETIQVGQRRLPNPIKAYQHVLNSTVNGSLCTIHGDLHVGNILIGPNEGALLIDFGRTRDGHTVFDWATLEISLLSELLVPLSDDSWDSARQMLRVCDALNHPQKTHRAFRERRRHFHRPGSTAQYRTKLHGIPG